MADYVANVNIAFGNTPEDVTPAGEQVKGLSKAEVKEFLFAGYISEVGAEPATAAVPDPPKGKGKQSEDDAGELPEDVNPQLK